MTAPRVPIVLSPAGQPADAGAVIVVGGLPVAAHGAVSSGGASSAYVAIPNTSEGTSPARVRLASTAAAYVRLGEPAEAVASENAAGTGYVVGDDITLTGGTFSTAMTLNVDTIKLVSGAINAIGSGYAVADVITLAGGTASVPATVTVATLQLATTAINAAGTGYVPADTITLAGGTSTTKAIVTVSTTKVVSATVAAAGTGGTPGSATVTGTTGTGTKFQATVTIDGGGEITSVDAIAVAGSYTANPTDIANEPVTGGGLTGAQLTVVMGAATFAYTNRGNYTVGSTTFTQDSTSGAGTGATFNAGLFGARTFTISEPGVYTVGAAALTQASVDPAGGTGATFNTGVFGIDTVSVTEPGDYTVNPTNPVSQGSTTGVGVNATFDVVFITAATAGDLLVQPGDAVIVETTGINHHCRHPCFRRRHSADSAARKLTTWSAVKRPGP